MSSQNPGRRYLLGQILIDDYFSSPKVMQKIIGEARHKVRGILLTGTHPTNRRHCTGVEGYVTGVGGRINDLTRYIMFRLKGMDGVYGLDQLPKATASLSHRDRRQILHRVHTRIISTILESMRSEELVTYDEYSGRWQLSHRLRVEHDAAKSQRRVRTSGNKSQRWRNVQGGQRLSRRNVIIPEASYRAAS